MPALLHGLRILVPGINAALRKAAVLSVVRAPVFVALPLTIRYVFDHAIPGRDVGAIALLGVAVLGLYLADGAIQLVLRRQAARFATGSVAAVRQSLADRVYALPPSWHDTQDR